MTLHLQFELSKVPALLIAVIGLNWLNYDTNALSSVGIWTVSIGMLLLAGYFMYETFNSANVLAKIRFVLLHERGTPVPSELGGID